MTIVKCLICNAEFHVKPCHLQKGWGKYCSVKCRNKSQLKGTLTMCFSCGKKVYRPLSKLKHSKSGKYFCSKKCQTLWRNSVFIEERSANWKNGIRVYRKIFQRKDVINKCLLCDISDKQILIIHHVNHNRNNNHLSNLKCLCLNCHHLVHSDKSLDKKLKMLT